MGRKVGARKLDEIEDLIESREVYQQLLDPYYKAITREYDFGIKMKQHKEEAAPPAFGYKKRREPLRVVTGDLPNVLRFTAATLSGAPIYLSISPRKPSSTPQETQKAQNAAAAAQAMMFDQVHDIDIGYPSVRRRMIRMAGAARAGAFKLDVCPGGLSGADVVPSVVDPRNLWWDPKYLSHMDYGCPMLGEDFQVTVEEAKNNPDWSWSDADSLRSDSLVKRFPTPSDPAVNNDKRGDDDDYQLITLSRIWLKDDKTTIEVEIGDSTDLPSQKWYMACPDCGYSEQDLTDTPGYDGSTLPEHYPCPKCGQTAEDHPAGMLHRIEISKQIGRAPAYNDKHRYLIVAPMCPTAGFARDGPWLKGLTNFPVATFVPDPFPLEPFGNSDTFRNQDMASIKNALIASGYEQMNRNRDLLLAKEDSLWDAQHEPYQFDGSGDFVAYVSSFEDLSGIKHVQGSGLNAAFPTFLGIVNNELQRFPGIGQINATAPEIKGMQVGVVARVQETGDVPLDEQTRILRECEEYAFTRWLELKCAYSTEAQWFDAVGATGADAYTLFSGSDMPALKLKVQAAPNLNLVDMQKVEKVKGLIGAPPELIKFALKDANVPQDVIDSLVAGMPLKPTGGSDNSTPMPNPVNQIPQTA